MPAPSRLRSSEPRRHALAGRPRRKGDDTRAAILTTAASLFASRGYDATSVSDIAEGAGVTVPGLYWHFDTKEDVLFTILQQAVGELGAVATPDPGASPRERLRHWVTEHVRFQLDQSDAATLYAYGYRQLRASLREDGRLELETLERRHFDVLVGILRDGRATGDFDVANLAAVAFAIVGMGEHVIFWFRPGRSLTAAKLGDMYADLAERMVLRDDAAQER